MVAGGLVEVIILPTAEAAPVYSGPVNIGPYTAEYAADCLGTSPTWTAAQGHCQALGSGWALATIPTAAASTAIASLRSDHMWVAGSDAAVEGRWVWDYGRLQGTVFYDTAGAPLCKAGAFCNFLPGQPNNVGGVENSLYLMATGSDSQRRWSDSPDTPSVYMCFACERSPCSITLDCNASNTKSLTGTYYVPGQHCGCVCKDGFSGPRCDDIAPVINVNAQYLSQFMVQCAQGATSWTAARNACALRGGGWRIATIGALAAQNTVSALTPNAAWIGASQSAGSVWSWVAGRLDGTALYRGAYAGASCGVPPCACEGGAYCRFDTDAFAPANGAAAFMQSTIASPTRMWRDAADSGGGAVQCYACERSLCADVASPAAAIGPFPAYYPNCTASATVTASASFIASASATATLPSATGSPSALLTASSPSTASASHRDHSHTISVDHAASSTTEATTGPATGSTATAAAVPTTAVTTGAVPLTATTIATPPISAPATAPPVELVAGGVVGNISCPLAVLRVFDGRNLSALRPLQPAAVTDALLRDGHLVVAIDLVTENVSFVLPIAHFAVSSRAVQDPRSLTSVVDLASVVCAVDAQGDRTSAIVPFQRLLCRLPAAPRYVLSGDEAITVSIPAAATTRLCQHAHWHAGTFAVHPSSQSAAVIAASAATTAASSVAVTTVIIFAEGSPIEIQLLVMVLQSACGSGADRDAVAIVRYFVSPFASLGPAWMAIGNVGLALVFALLHVAVTAVVHTASSRQRHVMSGTATLHATLARLRFPGIPLAVAQLLYAGVAFGTAAETFAPTDRRLQPLSVTLGYAFLVLVPVFTRLAVARSRGVWYERYDWSGGPQRGAAPKPPEAAAYRRAWLRRSDFNGDYTDRRICVALVDPIPQRRTLPARLLVGWVLPDGRWGPPARLLPITGLLDGCRVREERWALLPFPLALAAAMLLAALPAAAGAECANVFVAIGMLVFVAAVLVLLIRPHRAPIASLLTAACLVLVGLVCVTQALAMQSPGSDATASAKLALIPLLAALTLLRSVVGILVRKCVEPVADPLLPAFDEITTADSAGPSRRSTGTASVPLVHAASARQLKSVVSARSLLDDATPAGTPSSPARSLRAVTSAHSITINSADASSSSGPTVRLAPLPRPIPFDIAAAARSDDDGAPNRVGFMLDGAAPALAPLKAMTEALSEASPTPREWTAASLTATDDDAAADSHTAFTSSASSLSSNRRRDGRGGGIVVSSPRGAVLSGPQWLATPCVHVVHSGASATAAGDALFYSLSETSQTALTPRD